MLQYWQALSTNERIVATAIFLTTLTISSYVLGFVIERSDYGRRRRIWDVPVDPGQYRWELASGARFTALAVVAFSAAFVGGAVHLAPTTPVSFCATLTSGWLFFEVYYYVVHRALHTKTLVRFHRLHHRSRVTTPLTGTSMSTVEAGAWMIGYLLPPIVLSHWIPVSLEAFALFLVYHWGGNILGHINAELMPSAVARGPLSYLAHPFTYHSLHHARWSGHYALYSTAMDRSLGTEWADWRALHAQVMSGKPMRSLRAKGDTLGTHLP